jgi:hypothetical protein
MRNAEKSPSKCLPHDQNIVWFYVPVIFKSEKEFLTVVKLGSLGLKAAYERFCG